MLVSHGKELKASDNLKYFLQKNNFEKATPEDILRFTELDDKDIIQAMKFWTKCDDFVLSMLCNSVIYRKFPKTIISSEPFSQEEIQQKILRTNRYFKIEEGDWLVDSISRSLTGYQSEKQRIKLFTKTGKTIPLDQAENHLLMSSLSQTHTKYILSFPREI